MSNMNNMNNIMMKLFMVIMSDKKLPLGKLPLSNIVYLCGLKQRM